MPPFQGFGSLLAALPCAQQRFLPQEAFAEHPPVPAASCHPKMSPFCAVLPAHHSLALRHQCAQGSPVFPPSTL